MCAATTGESVTMETLEGAEELSLSDYYRQIRGTTEGLCRPLAVEDYVVQSMPDVSPTRWHLAHTSWFFETFVLEPGLSDYVSPNPVYRHLFNSYYYGVGSMYPRPQRGLLSRPTVQEVYAYREHVDRSIERFLVRTEPERLEKLAPILVLGLHHEQQHQELILTDIKHVLSLNPLDPIYRETRFPQETMTPSLGWVEFPEALREIGHEGSGFFYDNEVPRHRVLVPGFRLADRLVTNEEYIAFMEDGGYERPDLWLSDGWGLVEGEGWRAPLHWQKEHGEWTQFSLGGRGPVRGSEPVCHVTFYEADAYARWVGARLPTEFEWETAAAGVPRTGNLLERDLLHPEPLAAASCGKPLQLFGDVWEWTRSPYAPYPGYHPVEGALGEYNGKFMSNQMVLRGGSCATPVSHIRATYRNFFHPHCRWQFTGIRLAQDA